MQREQPGGCEGSEMVFQRPGNRLDHDNFGTEAPRGGGNLQAEESGAGDHEPDARTAVQHALEPE